MCIGCKHLPMSNLSWNTSQDFLKIPSLREAALETERRCFSKVKLESNVTANISRSTDSFSTVPSMVNGGGWGCIVRDLETRSAIVYLITHIITLFYCRGRLSLSPGSEFRTVVHRAQSLLKKFMHQHIHPSIRHSLNKSYP